MSPEDLGITPELISWSVQVRLALSAVLILFVIGARWLIILEIRRRSEILTDTQRWWITVVKNLSTLAILVGVVVLWAPELGDFALSITAFVLALVIATKELLLSISGAIWRGTTLPFRIGDWVEIGGYSGEVIDETLLVTQLQEIDRVDFRYTGRTVAVPNALLLNAPVVNHNFRKRFILHEFTLTAEPAVDALAVRQTVLGTLVAATAEFADLARRYAAVIEKNAGVKLPTIEPRVLLGTTELGNFTYRCSLFCPRDQASALQQEATEAFARAIAGTGER